MMLVLIFLTLNRKNMSYIALGELTSLFLSGAQFPLCPLSPLAYTHVICNNYSNQLLHHVWCFVTPSTATCQASLSITNTWSLLKCMAIELVMPSNHLIHCCPLLLPPSIFPSIKVFSNKSVLPSGGQSIGSFSFSISPFNEYSGLISFRIDWLDLLTVQGALKSLLQHHS